MAFHTCAPVTAHSLLERQQDHGLEDQQAVSSSSVSTSVNRSIGFVEARWCIRVTTKHLPKASNVVADASSRLNQSTHRECVPGFRYTTFASPYRPRHCPQAPEDSTIEGGISGATGVAIGKTSADSCDNRIDNPSCSLILPLPAGSGNRPPSPTHRLPGCTSVATYCGTIESGTGTQFHSPRAIALLFLGCAGCQHHHNVENQSP
ncbi:hypothetical protein PHMEG_00015449 [Phytophthora megakarya]|uniref:Uncharacterized protein n=1 Tax=Phytophthora megakarya TaxID=4795 RepID=A0A225W1S4_9STRA|nr:hypothetical protein PHMEG_00015449 [Phytophthora megakarya]